MLSPAQIAANVCYLETIGRNSGNPHEIEIWFAASDPDTVHMLSGGRDGADWVRNIRAHPAVRIRFGSDWYSGIAKEVEGTPDELYTRQALASKYYAWREGPLPNDWSRNSLPIRIQLE